MFLLLSLACLFQLSSSLVSYDDRFGYVLARESRIYVINYAIDVTNSGYIFDLDGYRSSTPEGTGPSFQFVNTFDRINKNLIEVNQTRRCGSLRSLFTVSSSLPRPFPSVGRPCLNPTLVLRRGYYYYFQDWSNGETIGNRMWFHSALNKLSGSRLSLSDGLLGNGGTTPWTISETETRQLYYLAEGATEAINGSIVFIDPCDNGGTSHGHGNCSCPLGFFGTACQFQTCLYGNGITLNSDDGCLCDEGRGGVYCEYPVTYNQCGKFQSLPLNITINPTMSECDCGAKWSDSQNLTDFAFTPYGMAPGIILRTPFNYAGAPMRNITQARVTCYYNVLCDGIAIWSQEESGKTSDYYFMFTYSYVYQAWLHTQGIYQFSSINQPFISSMSFYTLNRYYKKNCFDMSSRFNRDLLTSQVGSDVEPYIVQYIDLSFVYYTYHSLMPCPFTMLDGSCCFNFSDIATTMVWSCNTPNPSISDLGSTLSYFIVQYYDSSHNYPTWTEVTTEYIQIHGVRDGMNTSANCSSIPLSLEPAVCPDECSPNPCMNGATCVDNFNSALCLCSDGYSGDNCQTPIGKSSISIYISISICIYVYIDTGFTLILPHINQMVQRRGEEYVDSVSLFKLSSTSIPTPSHSLYFIR
jgi:hypothetical protein